MSTPKLTYAMLEDLADAKVGHNLEIAQVSMVRFGDDKSAIELGATVPFVARFALVATKPACTSLKKQLGARAGAVGDVVLRVNSDGELESDLEVELGDDVASWLADHYSFAFEVRGVDRTPFRPYRLSRVDADDYPSYYPWIQEITALAVRGELLDIELDIEPRNPPARARKRIVLTKSTLQVPMDQGLVQLELEVDGSYESPANLANGHYWIALHSDHQPDLKLKLVVHSVSTDGEDRAVGKIQSTD